MFINYSSFIKIQAIITPDTTSHAHIDSVESLQNSKKMLILSFCIEI